MFSFGGEWTCVYECYLGILLIIMEVYSLEDDDFGGLFITQSVSKSSNEVEDRVESDTECQELTSSQPNFTLNWDQYSDISEDEDDIFQSLQAVGCDTSNVNRFVN